MSTTTYNVSKGTFRGHVVSFDDGVCEVHCTGHDKPLEVYSQVFPESEGELEIEQLSPQIWLVTFRDETAEPILEGLASHSDNPEP